MYYNFSKFYILKPKQNGEAKPTGTAGEHPAPRPRNQNRGGTCGTLGEGGKIFGTQKTDTTETAQKKVLFSTLYKMTKKGLEFLQNCKTYDGQPVKEWLDGLLADKNIRFWFGTEWYRLTGGLYFVAGYNRNGGKSFEFGPYERQYIAEQKYPDTQKIIDAYNEAEKQHASKNWREFVELLQDAKIQEDLKKSLNTLAELSLIGAIYDEQHADK